jgi:hypothetical protein
LLLSPPACPTFLPLFPRAWQVKNNALKKKQLLPSLPPSFRPC